MPSFYQVYGWRSHVRRDNNIPLNVDTVAKRLWTELEANVDRDEEDRLQILFGLMNCGASYLLLSKDSVDRLYAAERRKRSFAVGIPGTFVGTPYDMSRFAFVSPISFASLDALKAKIKSYEHKSNKSKKAKRENTDNSQANKKYSTIVQGPNGLDQWTTIGIERVFFESQRVFYRICTGQIAPSECGVERVPWFNNIRAFSFAYTLWSSDARNKVDRLKDPRVLDTGYAEYFLPGGSSGLTLLENHHFPVKENSLIRNPGKVDFSYGEKEETAFAELSIKLQELFKADYDAPMILFVKDTEWALAVLRFFGVDTSAWSTAFEPLLGKEPVQHPRGRSRDDEDFRMQRNYRDQQAKSGRSRSPRRDATAKFKRPASPLPTRSPHPVYVIDIFNSFSAMCDMPVRPESETINSIAAKLGVQNDPVPDGRPSSSDKQAWCAGNEARLLGYIWSAMASGNAIDEQKKDMELRRSSVSNDQEGARPPPPAVSGPDAWDDDVDPNDIVPAPSASAAPKRNDPFATYEDEDDDWDDWS